MRTPILETDRLILRPLQVTDAEDIFNNWATDPDVAKYMPWVVHQSIDVTRAWLMQTEDNIDSDTIFDWGFVRKSDNKLIGSGGIYYHEDKAMFNMGYNLMKACWNQGYTTEAAARMLKFATEELNQKKMYAYHAKENIYSGKVLEKIGFRYISDTEFDNMDKSKHFEAKEYLFELP